MATSTPMPTSPVFETSSTPRLLVKQTGLDARTEAVIGIALGMAFRSFDYVAHFSRQALSAGVSQQQLLRIADLIGLLTLRSRSTGDTSLD